MDNPGPPALQAPSRDLDLPVMDTQICEAAARSPRRCVGSARVIEHVRRRTTAAAHS